MDNGCVYSKHVSKAVWVRLGKWVFQVKTKDCFGVFLWENFTKVKWVMHVKVM